MAHGYWVPIFACDENGDDEAEGKFFIFSRGRNRQESLDDAEEKVANSSVDWSILQKKKFAEKVTGQWGGCYYCKRDAAVEGDEKCEWGIDTIKV